MSVTASLVTSATVDTSCHTGEVARLLWSMITLAAGAGLALVVRPRWVGLAGVVAADLLWAWIDMEGPTLLVWGSHGIHLADVPVLVTIPALVIAGARLWLRRRSG